MAHERRATSMDFGTRTARAVAASADGPDVADRRLADRRRPHNWIRHPRWWLHGRRRHHRRSEDCAIVALDWRPPQLLFLSLAIFSLSILDANFSLMLIHEGIAEEANPLMAAAIQADQWVFVYVKLFATGFGLLVLVAHAHRRVYARFTPAQMLYALLCFYVVLIGYELSLLHSAF